MTGGLTPFQMEVAEAFFALPESRGFLLAGGAALLAQGLTGRPTNDLDLFTSRGGPDVPVARDALRDAVTRRGWTVSIVRDHETFCRVVVGDGAGRNVLVDLALDSAPEQPPVETLAGPAFAPQELAARKTAALFDRAEARDFADVFMLASRFGRQDLLRWASELDPGFDVDVFVEMLGTLARFRDEDIPLPAAEVDEVRRFFAEWAAELHAGGGNGGTASSGGGL
jgi:hypothetical protein